MPTKAQLEEKLEALRSELPALLEQVKKGKEAPSLPPNEPQAPNGWSEIES
jgi:hypothetical protein